MPAKKKSNLSRNRKKRQKSSDIRISKKQMQKIKDKKYNDKKKQQLKLRSTSKLKLKKKLNKINYTKKQVFHTPLSTMNTMHIAPQIPYNINSIPSSTLNTAVTTDINMNEVELSLDWKQVVQNLISEKKALQIALEHKTQEFEHKNEELQKARKQIRRYKKSNGALKQDVSHLIYETPDVEIASNDADNFVPNLSINISSDISIITERTLEPEFATAANEYIKVRLKCEVLKNSKSLGKLIHVLDVYNKIKNPDVKQLQLGGTSSASVDRLMQFKAFDLMRFETAMIIQRKWTIDSIITLYHDECSQRKESQLSMLMTFNTIVPEEGEYELPEIFTPKLIAGNVMRAIWHRNIPGKDTKTIMDWAIKPAIDELNEIGKLLYAEQWRCLRTLMEKKLAVMSDQNNGALDIGTHIVKEFKVRIFIQLICFMHNVHNMLEKIDNRLLYERQLELK
eukprot:512829_1